MPAPFITINRSNFNTTATHAARAISLSQRTRDLISDLEEIIAEMFQMFDGDGSSDAHYDLVTIKFGLESNAKAHILFDKFNGELLALKGEAQNAQAVSLATSVG